MSQPESPSLRIWHVAESYPPTYGGGAAIVLHDVCHALAERGHEMRVLCTEQRGGAPYAIRSDRDGPIELGRVNLPHFMAQDPDGLRLGLRKWRLHERKVAELIDGELGQWRPDLIVYNTTRPLGEECLMAIGRHGVPAVAILHEAWLLCPRIMLLRSPKAEACSGPGPAKCLECMYSEYDGTHLRAALKLSWRIPRLRSYFAYRIWRRATARRQLSGALAYSDFMAEVHRPHIRGPVLKVPLGVDLSGLPSVRPERPRVPLRFGFMGGFQPNKGVWDLLDAAAALKGKGIAFELHIWGPGQEVGEAEIAGRGLEDRVFLQGMYDDVWSAYAALDVAIIATTVPEPFGRIPIEAAASGAPTIGANVGGIRESIQHGENGLLFEFRNGEDLRRQMERVLEEPGLYEKLRDRVSQPFDTRTRGPAVEAAYRRVLAGLHPEAVG